jgi:Double zinc ribbon
MSLFHCRFCEHDNPAGARFCNECGSPLYLKPCPQCEAVNDGAAPQCFQCGAALPKDDADQEASVAAMAVLSNATESAGAPGGVERPSAPGAFTERFEIEFGEFRPSLFDDLPAGPAASKRATSDAPAVVDLRQTVPAASAAPAYHRDSVTRTGLAPIGALLVLALIVVGAAAYYVYEHSAADTKVAVAAPPPSADPQPAAEAKATPAAPNDAAPPPVATTPKTESTMAAEAAAPAGESENATSSAPPPGPVGARVEPRAATKAKSTAESRRNVGGAPGKGVAAQPARPATSSDASAVATQRIIEREVVGMRAAPYTPTRTPSGP